MYQLKPQFVFESFVAYKGRTYPMGSVVEIPELRDEFYIEEEIDYAEFYAEDVDENECSGECESE